MNESFYTALVEGLEKSAKDKHKARAKYKFRRGLATGLASLGEVPATIAAQHGHRLRTLGGSLLGDIIGSGTGAALGGLAGGPLGFYAGAAGGGMAGRMIGTHLAYGKRKK